MRVELDAIMAALHNHYSCHYSNSQKGYQPNNSHVMVLKNWENEDTDLDR